MDSNVSDGKTTGGEAARFATTRWSLILSARDASSPQAANALDMLCRTYWYPLYVFIRRQGHDAEAAKDLTQKLFARLLAQGFLDRANQEKGRFRGFLLKSARRFLIDEWDRARAQKRGGDKIIFSLDQESAEARYRLEPVDELSPDKLFDRRWAMTVLEQAAQRQRAEYQAAGKAELYDQLRLLLSEDGESTTYSKAAAALGMSDGTLKSSAHRMRKRRRQLVREVIADTVERPEQIDAEIRDLFAALAG